MRTLQLFSCMISMISVAYVSPLWAQTSTPDTLPLLPPTQDLIMYLDGNDTVTNRIVTDLVTVTTDLGTNATAGSVITPVYVDAPTGRGRAMHIDGTQWLINAGTPACVNTGSFTLGLWVYMPVAHTNYYSLFGTKDWVNSDDLGFNLSGGPGETYYQSSWGDGDGRFNYNLVHKIAEWQYITVTFDRTINLATLYCDGAKLAERYWKTGDIGATPFIAANMSLSFGDSGGASATTKYPSNSYQDEIALWSRALTEAEVAELYTVYGGVVDVSVKPLPPMQDLIMYLDGNDNVTNRITTDLVTVAVEPAAVTPTYVDAPAGRGRAMHIDGSQWLINAGTPACVNTGSFTIGLWVNILDGQNAWYNICGTKDWNNTWGLGFNLGNPGRLISTWEGETSHLDQTLHAITPNTWQYLTMTFDRKNNTIAGYCNGGKVISRYWREGDAPTNQPFIADTMSLVFGDSGGASATSKYPSNTYQDEIALWSRALTETEVIELYSVYGGVVPDGVTEPNTADATGKASSADLVWSDLAAPNTSTALGTITNLTGDTFTFNSDITANRLSLKGSGNTPLTLATSGAAALNINIWDFSELLRPATVSLPVGGTVFSGNNLTLQNFISGSSVYVGSYQHLTIENADTIPFTFGAYSNPNGTITFKKDAILPSSSEGIVELASGITVTIEGTHTGRFRGNGTLHYYGKNEDDHGSSLDKLGGFTGTLIVDGSRSGLNATEGTATNFNYNGAETLTAATTLTLQNNAKISAKNGATINSSQVRIIGANATRATSGWNDTMTFTGKLIGEDSASLFHVDGGVLKLTGDLSEYQGSISIGTLWSGTTRAKILLETETAQTFIGSLDIGTSTLGVLEFNPTGDVTVAGDIKGDGLIIKNGNASVILTTQKAITGTFEINTGTLDILATQPNAINLNGGTLKLTTATGETAPASLTLGGNATLDLSAMTAPAHITTIAGAGILTIDATPRALNDGDTLLTWDTATLENITFNAHGTNELVVKVDGNALKVVLPTPHLTISNFTPTTAGGTGYGFIKKDGSRTVDPSDPDIVTPGKANFVYAYDYKPYATDGALASGRFTKVNDDKGYWAEFVIPETSGEYEVGAGAEITIGTTPPFDTNKVYRAIVTRNGATMTYAIYDRATGTKIDYVTEPIGDTFDIGADTHVDALLIGAVQIDEHGDFTKLWPAPTVGQAAPTYVYYIGEARFATGTAAVNNFTIDLEGIPLPSIEIEVETNETLPETVTHYIVDTLEKAGATGIVKISKDTAVLAYAFGLIPTVNEMNTATVDAKFIISEFIIVDTSITATISVVRLSDNTVITDATTPETATDVTLKLNCYATLDGGAIPKSITLTKMANGTSTITNVPLADTVFMQAVIEVK